MLTGLGIIPAYAGSTTAGSGRRRRPSDHPRIRGEHAGTPAGEAARPGSSPHTRGAPRETFEEVEGFRIIPAYAGSTGTTMATCARLTDHPRIRGEHWSFLPTIDAGGGSSPHTRGALWPPTASI